MPIGPPEYGTNIRALYPIDTEQLRGTIEREIRRTLNHLAPGVDPGIILDVLVDVTVDAHTQVQAQVNVGFLHTVSYSPPNLDMATTSASSTPNWVNNSPPREERFRQEYNAEFLPANPEGFNEFNEFARARDDDMVDSVRHAFMGIDYGVGRDETVVTEHPRNPTPWSMRGLPPGRLDALMGRSAPRRPPNPIIEAVVRKKLSPPKPPAVVKPPAAERLTVWERIRKNYALFE